MKEQRSRWGIRLGITMGPVAAMLQFMPLWWEFGCRSEAFESYKLRTAEIAVGPFRVSASCSFLEPALVISDFK
jgi:hypothetical protein